MKKYEKILLFVPVIGYGFYMKHYSRPKNKQDRNLLIVAQIYQLILLFFIGNLLGKLI